MIPAIGSAAACAVAEKVKLDSDDENEDDEKKKNDDNGECPAVDKDGHVILYDNGNKAAFRKGLMGSKNLVSYNNKYSKIVTNF